MDENEEVFGSVDEKVEAEDLGLDDLRTLLLLLPFFVGNSVQKDKFRAEVEKDRN
jgi:hypothetical protein